MFDLLELEIRVNPYSEMEQTSTNLFLGTIAISIPCSIEKGVFKHFTRFTGKRLSWILLETQTQVSSCEFCKKI